MNRIHSLQENPKLKILIFLCEQSGKGLSKKYYDFIVHPILQIFTTSAITFQTKITKNIGYCQTYIQNLPPQDTPDIILTFSGDGCIYETINGFYQRDVVQNTDNLSKKLSPVFYFPFPTGSGNNIRNSRLFLDQPVDPKTGYKNYKIKYPASLTILALINLFKNKILFDENPKQFYQTYRNPSDFLVPAHPNNFDFLKLHARNFKLTEIDKNLTDKQSRLMSCISTAIGLIADIDKESEKLRFLGDARFDVYGFIRGVFTRKYLVEYEVTYLDPESSSGKLKTESFKEELILINAMQVTHLTNTTCVGAIHDQYLPYNSLKLLVIKGSTSKLQILKGLVSFGNAPLNKPWIVYNNCVSIKIKQLGEKPGRIMIDGEEVDQKSCTIDLYPEDLLVL